MLDKKTILNHSTLLLGSFRLNKNISSAVITWKDDYYLILEKINYPSTPLQLEATSYVKEVVKAINLIKNKRQREAIILRFIEQGLSQIDIMGIMKLSETSYHRYKQEGLLEFARLFQNIENS